ncbi:MAG: hypothetical protein RLZ44_1355 [Pseudomonadota bacterium]|jgi:pimeloyl-ACP methyl ester carboxylesterase
MRKWFAMPLLAWGLVLSAGAEPVQLEYQGLRLNANLEAVDGNWPTGPVVLMTHGTLAHGGMEIMRGLQNMFRDRGLSSLAITLSLGLDNRAGMYDCALPHTHKHTDALGEIGAWLDWLKSQGAERVALLGHSRGGNQTARFAATHKESAIVAVFLIAPMTWDAAGAAADYEARYKVDPAGVQQRAQALVDAGQGSAMLEGIGFVYCEDTQATADAFLSYHGNDPELDTPQLLPAIPYPVTVFAGSEDQVVEGLIEKTGTVADGEKIQLQVIDGAEHFFRDLYSEEIADLVAEQLGM